MSDNMEYLENAIWMYAENGDGVELADWLRTKADEVEDSFLGEEAGSNG